MKCEKWLDGDFRHNRGLVSFEIQDKKGNSKGQWTFPITYSDNRYSLILDAMMSAKVQAVLASGSGTTAEALARTSSTSICRLGKVASDLKNPQVFMQRLKPFPMQGRKTSRARRSTATVRRFPLMWQTACMRTVQRMETSRSQHSAIFPTSVITMKAIRQNLH